jgi:hypothetical protein
MFSLTAKTAIMVLSKVLTMEMVLMVYYSMNGLDSISLSNHGLWLIPLTILVPLGSMKGIFQIDFSLGMVKLLRSLAFLSFVWSPIFPSSNFIKLSLFEFSCF